MLLFLPFPPFPPFNLRYVACGLGPEWMRTNQKVRLLMSDMKGARATQHSTKKMIDETIV